MQLYNAPYTWTAGSLPHGALRLKRQNPLVQTLGFAALGSNCVGGGPFDYVGGCSFNAFVGTIGQTTGAGGAGITNAAASYMHTPRVPALASKYYTAVFIGEISDMSAPYAGLFSKNAYNGTDLDAGPAYALQRSGSGDAFIVYTGVSGASYSSTSTVLKPSSVVGKGVVTIAMSYGGTAGGIRLYLNGIYQETLTIGVDPSAAAGYVVLFNPRDLSTAVVTRGVMYALYMWPRQLSDAEIFSISRDPGQIFEPLVPNIWANIIAGGAAYSASAALGMTLGMADANSMSGVSALALGLGFSITSVASDVMAGALSLGVQVGTDAGGGQVFQVNLPLALMAGLHSASGLEYGASLALGFTLGSAIASAINAGPSAGLPAERVLKVQAEGRIFSIYREDRVISVVWEERTILLPKE